MVPSIMPGSYSYPSAPYSMETIGYPSGGFSWTPPSYSPPAQPIRILYNNDTHEHWHEVARSVNGFYALEQHGRMQGMDVLKFNAGDSNTGDEANEYGLSVMLKNLIGFHASTIGNHEFDMKLGDYLSTLQSKANFPTLISNIRWPKLPWIQTLFQSGHLNQNAQIIQSPNGPYAVLGVTRPQETSKLSRALKALGLDALNFDQTCRLIQAQVNQLETQGINKVILLSHMGKKFDQKLAQRVSGVDVIVGGDSHDKIEGIVPGENWFQSPRGEPVMVLQAGCNGQYIGMADVYFTPNGQVMPIQNTLVSSNQFAPNADAEALIANTIPTERVIAKLSNPYQQDNIHDGPDGVAYMVAQEARQIARADIGLVRSKEIRKSLPSGDLTNWSVKEMMPYNDQLVRISLTGREVLQALQESVSNLPKKGTLLHTAGCRYTIHKQSGLVDNVMVQSGTTGRWEAIQPNRVYQVALGEFAVNEPIDVPALCKPDRLNWRSDFKMRQVFYQALQKQTNPQTGWSILPDNRFTELSVVA